MTQGPERAGEGSDQEKKKEKKGKEAERRTEAPETEAGSKGDKGKKPPTSERLAQIEANVDKLMEFFSSRDLPELTQELKNAKGGLAGFNEILGRATESLGNLTEAFQLLEDQIEKGNIKSFKDLDRMMERITRGMEAKYEQAIARQKRLGASLEDEIKSRGEISELRKAGAAEMAAMVAVTNLASEKIRNLAGVAEASGLGFPAGVEKPPVWGEDPPEKIEKWFREKLKKMVIMKTPFAENWRMSWDLERFLASIPEEERAAYMKYAGWFDRVRTEHACHLGYDAAANVEAIQGVLGNLSLSTIQEALQDEEVVDQLNWFQKDAERVVSLREEQEKLKEEGKNKEAKKKEEEMNAWLKVIKHRLSGYEIRINPKTQRPEFNEELKFDEKEGLAKIEAGRMFIFLGMAAGYDIADLTGGDFFMARVNNLLNRVHYHARQEGNRWWKRDKLVTWMSQEIGENEKEIDPKTRKPRKITGLEVFTHKFAGGLLPSLFKGDKEKLDKFGLKWHREWVGDRFISVIKITDKRKLTEINFEKEGIVRENPLSADILDAARVADEVRSHFMAHNGYLDLPTWENFLKFADLFKHLRGSVDEIGFGGRKPKGGSEKDRLMALMHEDWLGFFKGPGKTTRFLSEILTAGLFPTRRPEYRFIKRMRAVDPKTGKEKIFGYSLSDSDGEYLGFGRSLNSVEVHGRVDEAVKAGCYSPQYAEGILRNEIKFLKIIPGIGPIRVVQEVIDEIGVGGFFGGFLAFIFAPILEFLRRMGKEMEKM